MQNDIASATEFLSKFSKLIRLVMENSTKEKILLSSEINTLRLYIEMEAMRFKEKIQYSIQVEKSIEVDYIEIPPMLLQPYIENAIWHGLMPKENGGKIDIQMAMNNAASLLLVSITDNGIGRKKSAEIKSRAALNHTSYGMKVTAERIALINQTYHTEAKVKVEDLFDEDRNVAGTKVTIQIPV